MRGRERIIVVLDGQNMRVDPIQVRDAISEHYTIEVFAIAISTPPDVIHHNRQPFIHWIKQRPRLFRLLTKTAKDTRLSGKLPQLQGDMDPEIKTFLRSIPQTHRSRTVVLISNDGDFTNTLADLKKKGMMVIVAVTKNRASKKLLKVADQIWFVDYSAPSTHRSEP